VAVQAQPRRRLPPEIFELPLEKLREGWYTDAYFNHTRATLLADGRHPRVVMQIFQKRDALIRGANDFAADIVLTDGRESAKVGRSFRPNPRLERVE
jgi:nicotinate phosphoribosyltransferase